MDTPSLASLGLAHLARPARSTTWLFVGRAVVAAVALGIAVASGTVVAVVPLIALLYGSCLTLVHHTIHGSLRLRGRRRRIVLSAGGLLVLNSGHALRLTHLQHHRTDPDADDPEGAIETAPWRRMPIEAVLFRYRLWAWAWRHAEQRPADRRAIAAEIAVHVLVLASAALTFGSAWSIAVGFLWGADVVFAVLAGKGPQTNWGRPVPTPLVAIRCRLLRYVLLGHNWHLEHHLYPTVPLPHLAAVADRLEPVLARHDTLTVELP